VLFVLLVLYTTACTNNLLLTTLQGWFLAHLLYSNLEFSHTEILCKWISWMVAQTMIRQLVSVVNTSIWKVALAHIAEQAFNGIGGLNVPVHRGRKRIKGQQVLFVLSQASYRFWIALAVFGFEGGQLGQSLLFCRLLPDANEFGLDVAALSSGDSIKDVALFMQQTALTQGSRKQFRDGCQQSVMPVGHDEVDLGRPSCSQVLQHTDPPIFAFFRAGSQG
jgi:hypothetical protein